MKLLGIAASHREGSYNRSLLAAALKLAEANGATVMQAEYADFDAPLYNDLEYARAGLAAGAERFVAALHACDGLMLASPEYNWSFPGSLKSLIDWASRASPSPFEEKPAFLMSATPSLRGGITGLVQLRVPLEALGTIIFPRIYTLGNAPVLLKGDALHDDAARALLADMVAGFMAMTARLSS